MTTDTGKDSSVAINWRHVGAFLGLTFGLTYLLTLVIFLRGGLDTPGTVTVIQLQMLLPAFSAIVVGLFFFPESPIYHGQPAWRERWFYYYFLVWLCSRVAFPKLIIPFYYSFLLIHMLHYQNYPI